MVKTMKKLSIDQIKKGDLLGKPEKITVSIMFNGEPAEFDTHILPFSYKTAIAQMQAYGEKKEALAGMLASVICDEDGNPVFTEEDVREKFNQALVDAIWNKVVDINMLGKKSNSVPKTSSSSKSVSPSGRQSAKSKRSRTRKLSNTQPTSKNMEPLTSEEDSSKN